MPQISFQEQQPGHILVEGALTFSNIDKNTVKSCTFLNTTSNICIDLKNVTATDSAGLALIVEWIKMCEHKNTHIAFTNIPQQLLALARLSGFDQSPYFATENTINTDL